MTRPSCFFALCLTVLPCLAGAEEVPLPFALQTRSATGTKQTSTESWLPSRSAIVVCDMWDLHHCKNAVTREGEMAPRMNQVLEKARAAGVLIIHAPSSCMSAYEGTPARIRATSAPPSARLPNQIADWCKQIPSEESAVYPIDQSDGGEDDDPTEHAAWAKELEAKGLNPRTPWTKQIDVNVQPQFKTDPAGINKAAIELADQVNAIVKSVFVDAFSGLGEAIGDALSGVSIDGAFSGIVKSLAGGLKAIGQKIIEANVQFAILKKIILNTLNHLSYEYKKNSLRAP